MAKKSDISKAGVIKKKPPVTESDVDSAVAAANIVGAELCVFIGGIQHHIGKVDAEGRLILLPVWRVLNSDARTSVRKILELRREAEYNSGTPVPSAGLSKFLGLLIPQLKVGGVISGGDPEYPLSVADLGKLGVHASQVVAAP